MNRLQLTILLLALSAPAAWAQEEAAEPEAAEPVAEESADAETGDAEADELDVTDEEIDELLGLDEDYADIEDEDFESTQEVRFEQNVVFPVDI